VVGSLHLGSALTAAFLASLVEAVEALTIVLAVAMVRGWRPAGLGALAGLASLALIVIVLGPLLDRVPLNLLQLAIGILLLLFGMPWLRKAILRAAGMIALHCTRLLALAVQAEQGSRGEINFGGLRLASGSSSPND
jgi:Ca2+/H+ antiporter, TMEM165/GDT1 family